MNGSARMALLLGMSGLLVAGSAPAALPVSVIDSRAPSTITLVGLIHNGSEVDPWRENDHVVYVASGPGAPINGALVKIDFSDCCDINLCDSGMGNGTVDCASQVFSGYTASNGEFRYRITGAAKDPGNIIPCSYPPLCIYGGCGLRGVKITADSFNGDGPVLLGYATAVTLDLNGAAGQSNGTTGSDISNEINLFGAKQLNQPYKGRGDFNYDEDITGADIAALIYHFGRLNLLGAVGCPGAVFCAKPACP